MTPGGFKIWNNITRIKPQRVTQSYNKQSYKYTVDTDINVLGWGGGILLGFTFAGITGTGSPWRDKHVAVYMGSIRG